ncbi:hypothetical protein ABPG72_017674 [Tetrahymena utriculariae]
MQYYQSNENFEMGQLNCLQLLNLNQKRMPFLNIVGLQIQNQYKVQNIFSCEIKSPKEDSKKYTRTDNEHVISLQVIDNRSIELIEQFQFQWKELYFIESIYKLNKFFLQFTDWNEALDCKKYENIKQRNELISKLLGPKKQESRKLNIAKTLYYFC